MILIFSNYVCTLQMHGNYTYKVTKKSNHHDTACPNLNVHLGHPFCLQQG